MKSKYYFQQFGKEIAKENKKYKSYSETSDVPLNKCDHIGKVEIIDGELRCKCGAGWRGSEVKHLFDLFAKK